MKNLLILLTIFLLVSNPLAAQEAESATSVEPAPAQEPKQTPDAVDDTKSGDDDTSTQAKEPAAVPPPPNPKNEALLQSVWDGDLDKIKLLVDKGADVNFTGDKKRTAVMIAVYKRNLPVIEFLVSKGTDINARDSDGQTALMYASRQRLDATPENSIALYLLNEGAEVNIRSIKRGYTALMIASESGNVELVQKLLEKGADPAIKDNFGVTALVVAQKTGHEQVVDLLSESITAEATP